MMGKRKRNPDHTNTQPSLACSPHPSGIYHFIASVCFRRKCCQTFSISLKFSALLGKNLVTLMGFFWGRGVTIYLHFYLNILVSFNNWAHIVWWGFFFFFLILFYESILSSCLLGLCVCLIFVFMGLFSLWSLFDWWGFCVSLAFLLAFVLWKKN